MLSHRTHHTNTQFQGPVALSTPQTDRRSSGCRLRGLCLLGLKLSPHRKCTVAALCLLNVKAESLALKAGLESSMAPERQRSWWASIKHGCPFHCLGKMNTVNSKMLLNIPVLSPERKRTHNSLQEMQLIRRKGFQATIRTQMARRALDRNRTIYGGLNLTGP